MRATHCRPPPPVIAALDAAISFYIDCRISSLGHVWHFFYNKALNTKKIKISIFFSSSCIFFNFFFNCIYREFFLINSENDKTVIPVLDTGNYMQNRLSYKILWSSQRMTVYITSQDDNDKYSSNPKI